MINRIMQNDLLNRLHDKAVALNASRDYETRDLVREARNALEKIKDIRDALEQLDGVLLLEYHNANWLGGDPKRRNEGKRELIARCLAILGTSAINTWG